MDEERLLNLHFSQLTKAWNKSVINRYSDKNKSDYHERLGVLFAKLNEDDFSGMDSTAIEQRKNIISFFFKSLEFLDHSVINVIPFEIVQCLDVALKEWNRERYIIVTSLANNINQFSFDASIALDDKHHALIKATYGIEFNSKLIQINLPRFLARDYLANAVLYHELGHFIDWKNNIKYAVYRALLDRVATGKLSRSIEKDINSFFPYLLTNRALIIKKYKSGQTVPEILSHIAEYFSDVFAAQYIGECSNYYLKYITSDIHKTKSSHPSTANRIAMVTSFLNGPPNYIIDLIKEKTFLMTKKKLKTRYKPFIEDTFLNFVPVEVQDKKQLHYLFICGWNTWLKEHGKFQHNNNMSLDLKSLKKYEVINNLIEKSIGNYIVESNWKIAKRGNLK